MGSGALWLASIALGMDAGLALVYPSWLRAVLNTYQYLSQYPRGSHASWATIIAEWDGIVISVSIDIPRYLGIALVAMEGHGRLPLFHYPHSASM